MLGVAVLLRVVYLWGIARGAASFRDRVNVVGLMVGPSVEQHRSEHRYG